MAFNPGAGSSISTASDTAINNTVNDNVLAFNGATQKWTNKSVTSSSITDFTSAVAALIGSKIAAGANTTVSYNASTGITTVSSSGGTGGGTPDSSNVIILGAEETSPPANTPVGTIILREVA
jgi:hypothetical protein